MKDREEARRKFLEDRRIRREEAEKNNLCNNCPYDTTKELPHGGEFHRYCSKKREWLNAPLSYCHTHALHVSKTITGCDNCTTHPDYWKTKDLCEGCPHYTEE